jgi:hypothetical protein
MKTNSASIAVFGILISCLILSLANENYLPLFDTEGIDVRRGLAAAGEIASYFSEIQAMLTTLALGNVAISGFILSSFGGLSKFDGFSRALLLLVIVSQLVVFYLVFVSRMEVFRLIDANAVSFQPAMDRLALPAFFLYLGFTSSVFLTIYLVRDEK